MNEVLSNLQTVQTECQGLCLNPLCRFEFREVHVPLLDMSIGIIMA